MSKKTPTSTATTPLLDALAKTEPMDVSTNVPSLAKRMLDALNFQDDNNHSVDRLAFETDPNQQAQFNYAGVFRQKPPRLLASLFLKRIAAMDDLVASIANVRSNMIGTFGVPRPDRFSFGFKIEIKGSVIHDMTPDQKTDIKKRIDKVTNRLLGCGGDLDHGDQKTQSLKEFLHVQVRNALIMGQFATEKIWSTNESTGEKELHAFRPIDAGSIYPATKQKGSAESVRKDAKVALARLYHDKTIDPSAFDKDKFNNDEYRWIQVIDQMPRQAFTEDECCVVNCYPVSDYELQPFPLTPIDTVISHIVTHINITTHNKLYFQNGRASRGMLVIQSDDMGEREVGMVRQQFQASVNSVNNSFRMPCFVVPNGSNVAWTPIDTGGRDMEFQYLSDSNARIIMSAFQISPDEIPGYSYLSRGSSAQSLAEGANEYLLEAHRDTGLRPLIAIFESFLNEQILPLLDQKVYEFASIKLLGLESDTAEKESVRFQTDGPIHMTFDEILQRVEKPAHGKEWAGEFPLNPQWQSILDKYIKVGAIQEHFFGMKGASQNPEFNYVRDPFYFQNIQLQMQVQQFQMQMQQMQAQMQQGAGPGGEPGQSKGGDDGSLSGGANAQGSQPGSGPTKDKLQENAQNESPTMDMTGKGDMDEIAGKAQKAAKSFGKSTGFNVRKVQAKAR